MSFVAKVARVEVGILCQDVETLARFWADVMGYQLGDLDSAGVYLDLIPPSPDLPVVFFQRAERYDKGPNRIHIDLYVPELGVAVSEAERLGASRVGGLMTGSEGGSWQILHDPEGNEFCLCELQESGA